MEAKAEYSRKQSVLLSAITVRILMKDRRISRLDKTVVIISVYRVRVTLLLYRLGEPKHEIQPDNSSGNFCFVFYRRAMSPYCSSFLVY